MGIVTVFDLPEATRSLLLATILVTVLFLPCTFLICLIAAVTVSLAHVLPLGQVSFRENEPLPPLTVLTVAAPLVEPDPEPPDVVPPGAGPVNESVPLLLLRL